MKVFLNKLKMANTIMKIFYFVTLIAYWVSYGFFCRSVLSLVGIETIIRFTLLGIFGIYGLIFTVFAVIKMFQHKKVAFLILTVFTLLFAIIFGVGSYYIDKIYNKIENFTSKETSTYTTVLLALSDTTLTNESKLGMITDEKDRTGYILPMEFLQKENMNQTIEYYSDYNEMLEALYKKEIDAIFVNKDYATIYGGEEKYQNIVSETKVLKEYAKEMKTEESELLASTKSLTEPFTVLVLGVDSDSSNGLDANAAFNGDTLMLITFNPKTLNATIFSVPRDMYVPIINSYGRNVGYNKINSSAAYGTASTVNTMENLTGIEIDYFVKVNFRGVIDLVNTLGGIDVDVEAPDYKYYISQWGEGRLCESDENRTYINPVCMNTGMQHLDGRQALAYARNRHGYLESDVARNRHQQQIIEAVAKKLMKTSNLSDFEKLLDTISNNIATNMNTSQILSFYQSIKGMLLKALNGDDFINIQKTQLTYFTFNNVYGLSCLGYYAGSLNAITDIMKENLGINSTKAIKTFKYDYSDDYEQTADIVGKGIYSGGKVPGSDITEAYNKNNENNNENNNSNQNNSNEGTKPVEPSDKPDDSGNKEDSPSEGADKPDDSGNEGDNPSEGTDSPDEGSGDSGSDNGNSTPDEGNASDPLPN